MARKWQSRTAWVVACLAIALVAGVARADDIPLVTGEHWTKSSDELRRAYLVGIANAVQVETAFHAGNPPPDTQSYVPRFVKGLKGHTLDTVRDGVTKWYAANPGRLQRPVIEVIWFEMVVPGLK